MVALVSRQADVNGPMVITMSHLVLRGTDDWSDTVMSLDFDGYGDVWKMFPTAGAFVGMKWALRTVMGRLLTAVGMVIS